MPPGVLAPEPMERALETVELYAQFCRAAGIDDVRAVATSAIRDAANRDEFLDRAALDVQVLSTEEEAFYGYLAAVNSTTLTDGVALDLGGGSMQLTRVEGRRAVEMRSWPLGAVRMTERFLDKERVKPKHLKALRAHIAEALDGFPWLEGQLAGIGGTVRNLAAAAVDRSRTCPRSASRGSRCARRRSTGSSTAWPTDPGRAGRACRASSPSAAT